MFPSINITRVKIIYSLPTTLKKIMIYPDKNRKNYLLYYAVKQEGDILPGKSIVVVS